MPIVSNANFRIAGTETSAMVHGCSPTDPKYPFCVQPHIQSLLAERSLLKVFGQIYEISF
jgi:hypothetical protein